MLTHGFERGMTREEVEANLRRLRQSIDYRHRPRVHCLGCFHRPHATRCTADDRFGRCPCARTRYKRDAVTHELTRMNEEK